MNDNARPRIRFCDEYEELLNEFLKALAAWSRLRGPDERFRSAHASAEMARGCQNYVAALWALRMHSRKCVICEETLRMHVNRDVAPLARLDVGCT
jgi:hypothetical protein